jgi:cell division protein FtsB
MISNYQNKKFFDKKIIFYSLLSIIILSFLIISNWRIIKERTALGTRVFQLKNEIRVLEEKNKQLKAGISETLQLDYTEKILREKGLYQKKGEKSVIIVWPEKNKEDKSEEKSIWEKILGKINLGN